MQIDMAKLQESADWGVNYRKEEYDRAVKDLKNLLSREDIDHDDIYYRIQREVLEDRIESLGNGIDLLSEEFTEEMYAIAYDYHKTISQFQNKYNSYPKVAEWEKLNETDRRMFYKIAKDIRGA